MKLCSIISCPSASQRSLRWVVALLISAAAMLATGNATAQIAPTPAPRVTMAPTGTKGMPFLAEGPDLPKSPGYVELEVFIAGTARSFIPIRPLRGIADGRWDATPSGPTAPYTTRLLIRMPSDAAKFNGTVLLDWMNVSGGFDIDSYGNMRDLIVDHGFAYVGVSAQAVGANFLPTWDAVRYAAISHPGDSFSYDIFSQAARAVRSPASDGLAPLGALTPQVKNLIAIGGSQSGARLFTYINAVQPSARMIDGFRPTVAGRATNLAQAPLPVIEVPTITGVMIRSDLDAPVVWINSETELQAAARGLHKQGDGPRFRNWEMTGAAHSLAPPNTGFGEKLKRMGVTPIGQTGAALPAGGPIAPPPNDLDAQPVSRTALLAIKRWIESGVPAPSAPPVDLIVPDDPSQPVTIVRNPATGIATGGLRMPDIAVPTRTVWGERTGGASGLNGGTDPWNRDGDPWDGRPGDISPTPEPSLASLYPTKNDYVDKITAATMDLQRHGFLLERDAQQIIEKARRSGIERGK